VSRTAGRKPIIVSFGDVAASGGYYIACAADSIFAMPNTITGSIGVITGKLDLSGLYDKVGLDKEVIARGRFADMYGADGTFSDEERAIVRAQMMRAYDRFVTLVADGRELSTDSVYAIAQGRVWSGSAAEQRGLVDRFADLYECITIAARMAGVNSGDDVEVDVLPEQSWELFNLGRMSVLAGLLPTGLLDGLLTSALGASGANDSGHEPAYEMPYRVTIR
jgi:protease-4